MQHQDTPETDDVDVNTEVWSAAELEAAVAAVYAARLPIPAWWPAEERSVFIEEYASEAACVLVSELDEIVDRVTNWSARALAGGRRFSADEISAMIAVEQQALLDDAWGRVRYDLGEAIARKSAALLAESVFVHPSRGQGRVIWPDGAHEIWPGPLG